MRICWYCGIKEEPWFYWNKKVIIDTHHISYTGKKRTIDLCRECHTRLHDPDLHKGNVAFRGAVRNPYFLYVLDGKMTIEEAKDKLKE